MIGKRILRLLQKEDYRRKEGMSMRFILSLQFETFITRCANNGRQTREGGQSGLFDEGIEAGREVRTAGVEVEDVPIRADPFKPDGLARAGRLIGFRGRRNVGGRGDTTGARERDGVQEIVVRRGAHDLISNFRFQI